MVIRRAVRGLGVDCVIPGRVALIDTVPAWAEPPCKGQFGLRKDMSLIGTESSPHPSHG